MSRIKDRFINPFTDFGFKKLFGTEPNKNLHLLTNRPKKLQEKVFQHLFDQAEIARYSAEEYSEYEKSLKYYRDLKNTVDTAKEEGREEGRAEIAQQMKKDGVPIETINKYTGLSTDEISRL